MKICERCGMVADESEIGYSKSFLYAIDDREYYEKVLNPCSCGADEWADAIECKICGSHNLEKNQFYGFCNDCIDQSATPKMAIEIGQDNRSKVEISGFMAYLFKPSEIEEILLRIAKRNPKYEEIAKKYCKEDLICFTGYLEEKCK